MTAGTLAANGRVSLALAKRGIRQALRRPQFIAPLLVFPTLMLAANTGGAGRATQLQGFPHVHGFLDFELAGAMMQSAMLAGVSGGIALALDFEIGFTDRLFAAPISRYAIIAGRVAATAVLGLMTGIWFVAGGLIFGAHIQSGVGGVIVLLALSCIAAAAFATLASALAIGSAKASVVQGIFPIVFVVLFLSTAFFPHALLLEPARTIARLNPLSLIADGMRGPIIGQIKMQYLAKALGGVAIVAAIGVSLSALTLRRRVRAG
jgi:ABC-2 type transport system permease protein